MSKSPLPTAHLKARQPRVITLRYQRRTRLLVPPLHAARLTTQLPTGNYTSNLTATFWAALAYRYFRRNSHRCAAIPIARRLNALELLAYHAFLKELNERQTTITNQLRD